MNAMPNQAESNGRQLLKVSISHSARIPPSDRGVARCAPSDRRGRTRSERAARVGHDEDVHDHHDAGAHDHAQETVNPFVAYRERLRSYRRWIDAGFSDGEFVAVVEHLDEALIRIGRTGFQPTPLIESPKLARLLGLPDGARLWVKDETHNVAGSHKARHLFGLLLHRAVDERLGAHRHGGLAIASCGNAAIAASTIAAAAGLRLDVFIPTWTSESIERRLTDLGAEVHRCERRDGEVGDPAYLRFLEAVEAGADPFSVQGTVAPEALDGGRTIGWEIADQLAEQLGGPASIDLVSLQVGGGAFASSLIEGLSEMAADGVLQAAPRVLAVQTESCAPLQRAWDAIHATGDAVSALDDADRHMTPWEDVGESLASGILDDVTYDWTSIASAMLRDGGEPLVVDEDSVEMAHAAGRSTGIDVCGTGTAGTAGLFARPDLVAPGEHVVVVFTGHRRD